MATILEAHTDTERLHRQVMAALDEIHDPCSVVNGTAMGLVEMGLIERVEIDPHGDVEIHLRLTSPFCEMVGFMRRSAEEKISALPGAGRVTMTPDRGLEWTPEAMSADAQRRRRERLAQMRAHRSAARTHPSERSTR